ncbi:MAG TPA: ABC transporter substrate-binding protein [Terriglobales bacterium]|nr:ABC transporter substrate-binding protein [Terriglobales bacterium]
MKSRSALRGPKKNPGVNTEVTEGTKGLIRQYPLFLRPLRDLRVHPGFLLGLTLCLAGCAHRTTNTGELRFTIASDPKTLNPLLVEDDSSEIVRYLTGGVLIRVNRKTQENEPALATSWKVSKDGRQIDFELRPNVEFSDGTPFTADDVVATMKALMDPNLHSSTGDAFRSGNGKVSAESKGKYEVSVTFPKPVAGMERLFDQVAISPARMAGKGDASVVLGPFMLTDEKPGQYVLLKRNPYYWKQDSAGHQLPYLSAVRLYVLQNRDTELLRFHQGDVQLINKLSPDLYEQLRAEDPSAARDLGPSVESEELWFNEVPRSPLPAYKKAWFRSRNFRRAISMAINRGDLARVAFRGHATASVGLLSPANKFWFDQNLKPQAYDPRGALQLLQQDGFRRDGTTLKDAAGHPVVFSLITNSGNTTRERMGSLIQQDLQQIGIQLNFVPLDFPSIAERITKTFDYESCLLGLTNVDLDPNGQMNVWLSSADLHQWNPDQKTPDTPWEAEIDHYMRAQASSLDRASRKKDFDKVQEIVDDEQPMLYLVDKNALVAVSPGVKGADPVVLTPETYWNVEYLSLDGNTR